MYRAKLIIIAFILILITFGLAVWANEAQLNLSQMIKAKQIDSFEKCASAGYPIQESYPRRCAVPNSKSFTEKIEDESIFPDSSGTNTLRPLSTPMQGGELNPPGDGGICVDKCGDSACGEIVCQGAGCPCAESEINCPQDCRTGFNQ